MDGQEKAGDIGALDETERLRRIFAKLVPGTAKTLEEAEQIRLHFPPRLLTGGSSRVRPTASGLSTMVKDRDGNLRELQDDPEKLEARRLAEDDYRLLFRLFTLIVGLGQGLWKAVVAGRRDELLHGRLIALLAIFDPSHKPTKENRDLRIVDLVEKSARRYQDGKTYAAEALIWELQGFDEAFATLDAAEVGDLLALLGKKTKGRGALTAELAVGKLYKMAGAFGVEDPRRTQSEVLKARSRRAKRPE